MLESAAASYAPIADHRRRWLREDGPPDLAPDQRRSSSERTRYERIRERMATDPAYREKRLAQARARVKLYRERHRERLAVARREYDKKRYGAKREELTRRKRELYVGERAERIRAANRAWYEGNRDKRREYNKQRRLIHGDEIRARERAGRRRSYELDPRNRLDYYKAWRQANLARARGYVRVSGNKRRAAVGTFSLDEWLDLLAKYEGKCAYCGSTDHIEVDHRTPLCRGGANTIENILPACRHCNRRKHRRTEEEFRTLLAEERTGD